MEQQLVSIDAGSARVEGMLKLPAGACGMVLFAHGSGSSRFSPRNNYVAGQLRARGMGTLLVDLLAVDEDQAYRTRFNIELLTARLGAAVDWLRAAPATRDLPLGLFGASTGAAAALVLASERRAQVAAVVSRGGRPDLAGADALGLVVAPTLLLVGGLDTAVIELNQLACNALASCRTQLEIIPGATHLFEEAGTLERVAGLAADWFAASF